MPHPRLQRDANVSTNTVVHRLEIVVEVVAMDFDYPTTALHAGLLVLVFVIGGLVPLFVLCNGLGILNRLSVL